MRKTMVWLLCLCMAAALLPTAAFAADAPDYILSETTVYGNGYPLLIEAGETDGTTSIRYDGDGNSPYDYETNLVTLTETNAKSFIIFAGGKNNTTIGTSSVYMTGGHVKEIYVGGLAKWEASSVVSATVTINGGSVDIVHGGGYGYGGTATVNNAAIYIAGGNVGTVYGGGYAYPASGYDGKSNVNSSTLTVTGGTVNQLYVSSRYANKWCDNSVDGVGVCITGGTITEIIENAGASSNGASNIVTVSSFVITGGSIGSSNVLKTPNNGADNGSYDVVKKQITLKDSTEANVIANEALSSLTTDAGYTYGMTDVKTDTSGKIYVWLPEGFTVSGVKSASGDTYVPGSAVGILKLKLPEFVFAAYPDLTTTAAALGGETFSVQNTSGTAADIDFIIAYYAEGGKMIGIESVSRTAVADKTSATVTFTGCSTAASAKIFAVSPAAKRPLCSALCYGAG